MSTRPNGMRFLARCLAGLTPFLVVGVISQAFADPIPIDGPVVITESGSYVVTRDFFTTSGYAIRLLGDVTVDIDFAGHTVGSNSTVMMLHQPTDGPQSVALTVHDGTVVGAGGYGAYAWTNLGYGFTRLTVSRMTWNQASAWIEDGNLTVTASRLNGSTMMADANRGGVIAIYEDNDVSGANLVVWGGWRGSIRGNRLDNGSIVLRGSDGFGPYGTVIEGNTLSTGSITVGQPSDYYRASDLVIRGNTVGGAIALGDSERCLIGGNQVAGCGQSGAGITINWVGRYNLIQGNILPGVCPYAISLGDITRGNVYRENVVTNTNRFRVLDEGESNVDGGGNKAIGFWKPIDPPVE